MTVPKEIEERAWPIMILQDRYSGSYSGGDWLAIANADTIENRGETRAALCLMAGPSSGDPLAIRFWNSPPDWIAVGNSPDAAREALVAKLGVAKGRL